MPRDARATDAAGATAKVQLLTLPPILWTQHGQQQPLSYFRSLANSSGAVPPAQLFALLSADSAALAVCRGGEIVRHKTMTGYTVRKNRNGKAQLTYERSSAGVHSPGSSLLQELLAGTSLMAVSACTLPCLLKPV